MGELTKAFRFTDHWWGLVFYVAAGILFAEAGLAYVRYNYSLEVLKENNEVVGHYVDIFGIIYAILVGFVVFVVWSEFNDAQKNVELEANALADLFHIVKGFPSESGYELRKRILAYALAVINDEWELMKGGAGCEKAPKLDELWLALSEMSLTTPREEALYAEALQRLAFVSGTRSFRLLHSKPRVPGSLWALLLIEGAITVLSMDLFGLKSLLAHALMAGAVGGSIAFILFLIMDLDYRFSGIWTVTYQPIKRVICEAKAEGT